VAAVGVAAPLSAAEVSGDHLRVTTTHLDLTFALDGANPVAWSACHPSCVPDTARRSTVVRFTGEQDGPQARLQLRGEGLSHIDPARLRFTAAVAEDAELTTVTFEAPLTDSGARLVKAYGISKKGYDVSLMVEVRGRDASLPGTGRQLELALDAGRGLAPLPAPGFAAMLERVHRVLVWPAGVRVLGDEPPRPALLGTREWVGVRNRFWALLVHADDHGSVTPRPGESLTVRLDSAQALWRLRFYSGPVEPRALAATDPELGRLFLSGLWTWLRGLSLGLLYLLRALTAIIGNAGLAIVALAGAVKLLLLPLALLAGQLQAQVQATQARLQPDLDAINAAYRGEERTRRTVALYRQAGVSPLYPLRSLVGFLIQIPVFIAAFDMLAENFDLQGVPFLWIRDLSRPDALARLPACVPFFGCDLNLLPFLMSGISIGALLRHHAPLLTPALVRRQRRNLTAMSVAFFFLFYTFPAGMVLYWTSTNFVQLASQEIGGLWRGRGTGKQALRT